jgi:hypothetical protein
VLVVLGVAVLIWNGFLGAGLGVATLTLVAGVGRRRPAAEAVWAAGLVGHPVSAFPDVLFMLGGVLHAPWMDVFVAHIGIHFVPAPLIVLAIPLLSPDPPATLEELRADPRLACALPPAGKAPAPDRAVAVGRGG